MSDENSEVEDDISLINIELESFEALSTISSSPSQTLDLGQDGDVFPQGFHIVHQLLQREIGLPRYRAAQMQAPLKSFSLFRLFPEKVLEGQIFMGMTRCGRFLMTYSTHMLPMDEEWYGCVYRYQLHWWIFPAEGQCKELASVSLFGNAKLSAPLQIYICQWPKFNDKVLVYGLMKESGNVETAAVPANQRAFVTATAIPSANHCPDCATANEATCPGLASVTETQNPTQCLKHSFTIHTSFDIAVPYPEFQPRVHLKFEDFAVFNTNNALHALRITVLDNNSLPELEVEAEQEGVLSVQVPPSPSPPCPAPSRLQEQIIRDFADDGSLTPRRVEDPLLSCLSPPLPTRVKTFPEHDRPHPSNFESVHEFLTPRVFLKVKKCGGKRLGFRPFFSRRKGALGLFLDTHARKSSPYEFVDDSQSEVEKLSQFRRKRLADKTYEFQECDSENIVPFSLARQGPGRHPSQLQVLRPLNRNTLPRPRTHRGCEKLCESKTASCSASLPRIRVADGDILVHDISGRYGDLEVEDDARLRASLRRLSHCFRGSASRFIRRFHETDEERTSVVTDVEDDEASGATGYHTLLNLDVHGPGYMQLQLASTGAPVRLGSGCVRIEQQSLDIEAICQSVATSLCLVANKTFTFCNDYDVEVLDVCPRSGDVLVLLMMRIEGCEGKKEEGSAVEQFEASVTVLWNLLAGDYHVIMVVPPQKMQWAWNEKATWNPARAAFRRFRASLPADVTWAEPSVRLCTNTSFLRDVMSVCSDDTDVLLLLPPDLFLVPDDSEQLSVSCSIATHLHNLEDRVDDIECSIVSESMRRYGSADTLTPPSRISLRSRSLQTTPLKYGSPHKNILTSEPYVFQKERDDRCLREIDEYFRVRNGGSDSERRPSVPALDLPQVQEFISKMEETERDIADKSSRDVIRNHSERSEEGSKPIESIRRSLNFNSPSKPSVPPEKTNLMNQTDHFKNQLSIKTDEPGLHQDQLLSLHNLWAENSHAPRTTTYEELRLVRERLEEERLRRQHCEDLIRDLQKRLLESQEKMAVAFRVDQEKDVAIKKLREGWSRVVEQWKESDCKKNELEKKLADEKGKFEEETSTLTASVKRYEQELLKALNLVHEYNEEQKSAVKERDVVAAELSDIQEQIRKSNDDNAALQSLLAEKEEMLAKSNDQVVELASVCKELKKQLRSHQNDKDRLALEKEVKHNLQKKLDDALKREGNLQEQLRSAAKTKTDLKQYYQSQVENIVTEKQKDFQMQLANGEKTLLKQLEAKERAMADAASHEKQQLVEKHKLEVVVIEETHREEIKLYNMKIAQSNSKIEDLRALVGQQADRQHELAEKLYSVIQTQWEETLKVISTSKQPANEEANLSGSRPILKRQNTFTKDEKDKETVAAESSERDGASTLRRMGSMTYRINETPQKMPPQQSVKDYIEQLLQIRGLEDSGNSLLEGGSHSLLNSVNDASSSSKERGKSKSDKSPWK